MKTAVVNIERSARSSKTDIYFPDGLIGFGEHKEFSIITEKSKEPFFWMQSEKDPELSFIIMDPQEFKSDYVPAISESDKKALGVGGIDECKCYVFVVVPEQSDQISANLLAPVVVNKKENIAKQVILQDQDYSVQHLILDEMLKQIEGKDVSSFAQAE